MQVVTNTEISEYKLLSRGKVRDIYDIDEDSLLIITTDRMSAFDVIMNEPIPYKGVVLNQISIFWMEQFKDIIDNHIIESDVDKFPAPLAKYKDMLEGRSILVKKASPVLVECIVRGHITGSGFKDYLKTGKVCGIELPTGLVESDKLAKPLFTPSTKAELGEHDENISFEQAVAIVGQDLAEQIRDASLEVFSKAREIAEKKGIIIADTKFEFGMYDGKLIIIDEALTPDSSRFWPLEGYTPGKSQPSFDKQYLRDYLLSLDWDQQAPAPNLPQHIIDGTANKYLEAYRILTGKDLF